MQDLSQYITENPIETFKVLKHICNGHLGTFSNGAIAAWLRGKEIPSQLSTQGCLLLLDEDFVERDRTELAAGQIRFRCAYKLEVIQYGDTPQIQRDRRAIKHKLTTTLKAHWRPAVAVRGQYPRAICYIDFDRIENRCLLPAYPTA